MLYTQENSFDKFIEFALQEDLGTGDITSLHTINKDAVSRARFVVKEPGVVAGLDVAKKVFKIVDPELSWNSEITEGENVLVGTEVASVSGKTRSILSGERVSLNFLQRMSGIATLTSRFVDEVQPFRARILDTRKTAPGLREFDKLAVKLGGGENHRFGLFDMILVKDNHIAASGGIASVLEKVFDSSPSVPVEVEVTSLGELLIALSFPVDRIMLDNMSVAQTKAAVSMAFGRVPLEASGGITLLNVREVASTGVDFISIGALTHSPKALDISLEMEKI